MNQCQYDCKICVKKPFKSFTRAGFKSHLSNAHNLTIDEYKGQATSLIFSAAFRCSIKIIHCLLSRWMAPNKMQGHF